jgi:hypothetical protein
LRVDQGQGLGDLIQFVNTIGIIQRREGHVDAEQAVEVDDPNKQPGLIGLLSRGACPRME